MKVRNLFDDTFIFDFYEKSSSCQTLCTLIYFNFFCGLLRLRQNHVICIRNKTHSIYFVDPLSRCNSFAVSSCDLNLIENHCFIIVSVLSECSLLDVFISIIQIHFHHKHKNTWMYIMQDKRRTRQKVAFCCCVLRTRVLLLNMSPIKGLLVCFFNFLF